MATVRGMSLKISSVLQAVVAVALGGLLGFMALWLREMGMIFAGATLTVLVAFYASSARLTDAGWLLLAAGVVPGLILARSGLEAVLRPSIEVGPDTWILLLIAIVVASAGGLILYSRAARDA
jgi:hypothetical protein